MLSDEDRHFHIGAEIVFSSVDRMSVTTAILVSRSSQNGSRNFKLVVSSRKNKSINHAQNGIRVASLPISFLLGS